MDKSRFSYFINHSNSNDIILSSNYISEWITPVKDGLHSFQAKLNTLRLKTDNLTGKIDFKLFDRSAAQNTQITIDLDSQSFSLVSCELHSFMFVVPNTKITWRFEFMFTYVRLYANEQKAVDLVYA